MGSSEKVLILTLLWTCVMQTRIYVIVSATAKYMNKIDDDDAIMRDEFQYGKGYRVVYVMRFPFKCRNKFAIFIVLFMCAEKFRRHFCFSSLNFM